MPSKQKAGYDQDTNPLQLYADHFSTEIFQVVWELQKQGKAKATIKNVNKALKVLARNCNLNEPEAVRGFIARLERKNGYKRQLCYPYDKYTERHNLSWNKPNYYAPSKTPKIPQENKINLIIANAPQKLGVAIAISRDTGLRPVELMNITLRNLDLANGTIYPETAKRGSPRVLKLRNSTLNVLNKYLANRNIGIRKNIFRTWNSDTYGKWFRYYLNKIAEKLQDPSIKTIRLYDLRHFFATMTYHKTKDILFVKQQMGHRKIETTLVYTQLLQFDKDESYTCKVGKNIEEATQLAESGFEYVTEMDGLKLFRKRK
jgi:integrase